MLSTGVVSVHGPNRISIRSSSTSTYALSSFTPKGMLAAATGWSRRNRNRWWRGGSDGRRRGLSCSTRGWWPGRLSSGTGATAPLSAGGLDVARSFALLSAAGERLARASSGCWGVVMAGVYPLRSPITRRARDAYGAVEAQAGAAGGRRCDMQIAVIGTGFIGGILGRALAGAGHDVRFGSRHPEDKEVAGDTAATVVSVADALSAA